MAESIDRKGSYIVLRRIVTDEPNYGWEAVHEHGVEAANAETAIRMVAKDDFGHLTHEKPGVYVAIPMRSWKPVTVKAETTTILKIEAT